MKTLVLFTSRYGSTAAAAKILAEKLSADLADLRKIIPDVTGYDTVIIGSPIFAGSLPPKMKKFLAEYTNSLLEKRLGLFICCAHEGAEAAKQIDSAFPAELVAHAQTKGVLGGAVNLEKHNFLIRALLKKVGIKESFDRLDVETIATYAAEIR